MYHHASFVGAEPEIGRHLPHNGTNSGFLFCPGSCRPRRKYGKLAHVVAGAAVGQHHVHVGLCRVHVWCTTGKHNARRTLIWSEAFFLGILDGFARLLARFVDADGGIAMYVGRAQGLLGV